MTNAPGIGLRVSVLGPVRAWVDDRELLLGPARRRTVFAVLAAHANRTVSRDEIVHAVWGPSAPATAAGNIYTYVSGLRRSLEPERSRWSSSDVLVSGPAGYSLRLAAGALDADRFLGLRTEAAGLAGRGHVDAAVARLDEALALWHGDAYAGLSGPFVELDRQRLAELRLSTVEHRARLILEIGEDDSLVAELAAMVREYPLREPLYELLMLALHRAGRDAEALEAFRDGRRTLVRELGVEPGAALRELHQRILAESATPPALASAVIPPQAGTDRRPFVGRHAETDQLGELLRRVADGRGATVWIEGEPGIGKSELLAVSLGAATTLGCQLAWGVADELGRRVPLQVLTEALGLDPKSPDPRLAALAAGLHGDPTGSDDQRGPAVAVDRLLAYVRSTCAAAPLVLVIDDMQLADEISLLVWERLVALTRRLPLLLVAAARPEPNGRELARLRRGVEARNGHVLSLSPLPDAEIVELFGRAVGALPGDTLRSLAARTGGNPLYARAMVTGLLRRHAVRVTDGVAEVDPAVAAEVPRSLIAAVRATLDFLTGETKEMLRQAALLGVGFAIIDVAAVTGRSPFDLMSDLDEAIAANVVVDTGTELAFRHPFLRQALIESVPAADRPAMHRRAAEALARAGSSVVRVAEQLVAEAPIVDGWLVEWLVRNRDEIARRAPQIAGDLLRLALDASDPAPRELLLIALVKLDFRRDRYPVAEAREALDIATDPADRAEMRQLLAAMRFRQGDATGAIALLRDAVDDPAVPEIWRTRHRVLLANFRRGSLDDLDHAERAAREIYAEAAAAQPYEAAFAQQTLWLTASIRRDHDRALRHIERALSIVRERPELASMCFDLLDNKMFSLQNLDRLDDAERTLGEAAEFAARHDLPASLQVATAVQAYWRGRWDDALAQISAVTDDGPGITFHGMREPGAVRMLLHGVGALAAGHRDMRDVALGHLAAAEALPASAAERESCDFLIVAQALAAEQQDRPDDALTQLAPLLQPAYAPMMLRHQWLPDIIRLALSAGRRSVAERAMEICAEEAAKEVRPARAYAADARCRALMTGDVQPARLAVAHYRQVGRLPELAATLEDAAALAAAGGRTGEAVAAAREALDLFSTLGAAWDIGRARRRLARYGIALHDLVSNPA
ncbi:MAG TPA: BTAD domain-containing putative transcriptional regulator [Actinoplanes sp.]|nr:BTAD domain-containing putative transcriptional regulator [Actinoplanes sp.]